jgi:hypothetical protein
MANVTRRGFARLAPGLINSALWTPADEPSIDRIIESSAVSLAAPQPVSSMLQASNTNPLSEGTRWDRNGFRYAQPGRKLRIPPE